jgi:hypothetical protein
VIRTFDAVIAQAPPSSTGAPALLLPEPLPLPLDELLPPLPPEGLPLPPPELPLPFEPVLPEVP